MGKTGRGGSWTRAKQNHVIAAIAISLISAASPAQAGYVSTRATWQRLSPDQQRAYVMGMFDGSYFSITGDDASEVWYRALMSCVDDNHLSDDDLVALVRVSYAAFPNEDEAPGVMLNRGLKKLCSAYLPAFRFTIPPAKSPAK